MQFYTVSTSSRIHHLDQKTRVTKTKYPRTKDTLQTGLIDLSYRATATSLLSQGLLFLINVQLIKIAMTYVMTLWLLIENSVVGNGASSDPVIPILGAFSPHFPAEGFPGNKNNTTSVGFSWILAWH